ncbi:MAG: SDR family NAD(P)-dependent oxidoreductase [Paracoccaceae bacterium]
MKRETMGGKTYWLIGASEGLGRALALELDRIGTKLVISARSERRLQSLAKELAHDPKILTMDVTSAGSVQAAVDAIGDVDGIVYLAGAYEPMTAQDWGAEVAERVSDVNFMGAVRVFGRVMPGIVARGRGHLVLIGSLAGYRGLPGAIGYGASKAALMHLAETMQADLWHTDIRVQLLNPGFIRTRLTDKNSFKMPFLLESDEAAKMVCKLMQKPAFKHDFPYIFSLFFRIGRLLPQGVYQRLFAAKP